MKSMFKNESLSEKLSNLLTNTALTSSGTCQNLYWQQAKVPKCILEMEIKESNKQK